MAKEKTKKELIKEANQVCINVIKDQISTAQRKLRDNKSKINQLSNEQRINRKVIAESFKTLKTLEGK